MNKFITVVAILCMLSSLFVIYKVDQVESVVLNHEHVIQLEIPQKRELPLEPSTPTIIEPPTISADELLCLQKNIYFESRDQSVEGMIGVAWVTFNRVESPRFRNTICEVVYRARTNGRGEPIRNRCQFSWYCDGKSDEPDYTNKLEYEAWVLSGKIAKAMILACTMDFHAEECPEDVTHGSVFYHNDTVNPEWTHVKTVKIDNHQYYRLASE